MDAIFHDLLLFVSVIAPPIIFGFLLYFGLHISDRDDGKPRRLKQTEQKHPFKLQP